MRNVLIYSLTTMMCFYLYLMCLLSPLFRKGTKNQPNPPHAISVTANKFDVIGSSILKPSYI